MSRDELGESGKLEQKLIAGRLAFQKFFLIGRLVIKRILVSRRRQKKAADKGANSNRPGHTARCLNNVAL